jgi:NADH dehydrogenase FAD-containing subunit
LLGSGFLVFKGVGFLNDYWDNLDVPKKKQKVVILGSGWGALAMLRSINTNKFDVHLVSPRNYFMFTPLLADSTVGSVDAASLVEPIRRFAARQKREFTYYEASCTDIDPKAHIVTCVTNEGRDFKLKYDKLVIAVGAVPNTLEVKDVDKHCLFLRDINDSRTIRNKIIDAFEKASLPTTTLQEKQTLLNFVVVGGGPIACEIAAQLQDYINIDIKPYFPVIGDLAKVTLIETEDHIHNFYDRAISEYMSVYHHRKEVQLIKGKKIVSVGKNEVDLDGKDANSPKALVKIPFGVCIWATGIAPHPLIKKLCAKIPGQRNTRAIVTDLSLSVQGVRDIYAIGDCATIDQGKLLNKCVQIFNQLDVNGDGRIDRREFEKLVTTLGNKFPALLEVANYSNELFELADVNKDGSLDVNEFKIALRNIDHRLTRLPTTATVATQQGTFLGKAFNRFECNKDDPAARTPFRYKHLGGYEYVGAEDGFVERGSKSESIVTGLGAFWLWRAVYYSQMIGLRTRVNLFFDKVQTFFFGRTTSRA